MKLRRYSQKTCTTSHQMYTTPEHKSKPSLHSKSTSPKMAESSPLPSKCLAHGNNARAICSFPDCESKFLCAWDLRDHPHPQYVFHFSELSHESFVDGILAYQDFNYKKKLSEYENQVDRTREQLISTFDKMKNTFRSQLESRLNQIGLYSVADRLKNLQQSWKTSQRNSDLQELVFQLNRLLFESDRNAVFEDNRLIANALDSATLRLRELASSVCGIIDAFGKQWKSGRDAVAQTWARFEEPLAAKGKLANPFLAAGKKSRFSEIVTCLSFDIPKKLAECDEYPAKGEIQLNKDAKNFQIEDNFTNRPSIMSQGYTLNESSRQQGEMREKQPNWNFGLVESHRSKKVSLPGTIYFNENRRGTMNVIGEDSIQEFDFEANQSLRCVL